MRSIALVNGTVLDGTGGPRQKQNLLIKGERVTAVGEFVTPSDAKVIDCSGLCVAPGFIDGHSHSDLQVLEGKREKLRQGVTTEVIGNCGFSAFPPAPDPAALREFANGILCGGDRWGWPSTRAYLEAVSRSETAHVVPLAGHGTLRIAVAGTKQGALTERELRQMEALLEEAFAAGAAGFSTGLMYAPGSSAPPSELERLCRLVAKHDRVYASHIRSYFAGLVSAIEEQIDLARRSGCRLQISHLQAVGAANWSQHQRALDALEKAHAEGIDLAFDCYPYLAGSSVLTQLLPQWALEGGTRRMLSRLTDHEQRKRIAREVREIIAWEWMDIYISAVGSAANRTLIGLHLAAIAERRGVAPAEALLDLLAEEEGNVNMVSFNQSEENLRLSLTHPLANVVSDGYYVRGGRPHPRLAGTFPLLLGTVCRGRGWLSLEGAVHKITGRTAERFHLRDRGVLRPGAYADVVLFDAESIDSPATYEEPEKAPVGIIAVLLGGRVVEGNLPES